MESTFASSLEKLKSENIMLLSSNLTSDGCLFPIINAINDSPALSDIKYLQEFALETLQIKPQTFEDLKFKCTDDNNKNPQRKDLVSV